MSSELSRTGRIRTADVAFALPLRREFTYLVPDDWPGRLSPGLRVQAPLGRKNSIGVVVACATVAAPVRDLKSLIRPVDADRRAPADVLKLARWVADYYHCAQGEVLAAAMGPVVAEAEEYVRLCRPDWDTGRPGGRRPTAAESAVLRALRTTRPTAMGRLRKVIGAKARIEPVVRELVRRGLVASEWRSDPPPIPRRAVVYGLAAATDGPVPDQLRARLSSTAIGTQAPTLLDLAETTPGGMPALRGLLLSGALHWDPAGQPGPDVLIDGVRPEPAENDLDPEQKTAAATIGEWLAAPEFTTALLWGPTGSGKTAVYCAAIRRAWALGRRALYLVPEIGLATQLIHRLRLTLGEPIAVWHSGLSALERYWMARLIAAGRYRLVVGARSAVFAPMPDLGLIIVDEEHAETYKQSQPAPRYNARDVAVVRARLNRAVCVLGSATPSTESYHNAASGKYHLLRLSARIGGRPLPTVRLVDLRERADSPDERWLTKELRTALTETLSAGRKAIVFLNRRGHSTLVACRHCGYTERCPACGLTLTYHARDRRFRCHLCTHVQPARSICPSCGGSDFVFRGVGTQKIEDLLAALPAPVRLARLDADVAARRGAAESILAGFAGREYNLLVGTQMVTKGLDVADVGLVGVIWADQQMAFPDFRAEEKTFQLLTQVAGRAGRGGDASATSRVLVQTFHPDHELIGLAAAQDAEQFFTRELPRRRELHYPPFTRLILLRFAAPTSEEAAATASRFAEFWQRATADHPLPATRLLGPAPAAVPRRAATHLYHVLIKTTHVARVSAVIAGFEDEEATFLRRHHADLTVDVDPTDFM
ncbi:MAG TPA: primosomal protein N' [Acidobacteriota bacterium]|nr:primosomal protein N' [Acidobacteriota bacterium]